MPRQAVFDKDGKNFVYRRGAARRSSRVQVELGAARRGRVVVTKGLPRAT